MYIYNLGRSAENKQQQPKLIVEALYIGLEDLKQNKFGRKGEGWGTNSHAC